MSVLVQVRSITSTSSHAGTESLAVQSPTGHHQADCRWQLARIADRQRVTCQSLGYRVKETGVFRSEPHDSVTKLGKL